jgi:hypothetical protein
MDMVLAAWSMVSNVVGVRCLEMRRPELINA